MYLMYSVVAKLRTNMGVFYKAVMIVFHSKQQAFL